MKNLFLVCFCLILTLSGMAQSVAGIWKTVDDEDGKTKSQVELTIKEGTLTGNIIKILDPTVPELCGMCKDDLKDSPMIGLPIIKNMQQDGDEWNDGKIMDPANGKVYKCKISLESADVLLVRGYIGFSLMGRTQKWYRVKGSTKTQ
jgi:uncharacterized protein (DUF2147 family)